MELNAERLLREMKHLIAQTEALLEAGGERMGATRTTVAAHLATARDGLRDFERAIARGGRRTMRRVEHYAHDNPWELAGATLVVGLVLGMLLGLLAGPRRD